MERSNLGLLIETGTIGTNNNNTERESMVQTDHNSPCVHPSIMNQQTGNAGGYGNSNNFPPKQDMEYICAGASLRSIDRFGRVLMEHRL